MRRSRFLWLCGMAPWLAAASPHHAPAQKAQHAAPRQTAHALSLDEQRLRQEKLHERSRADRQTHSHAHNFRRFTPPEPAATPHPATHGTAQTGPRTHHDPPSHREARGRNDQNDHNNRQDHRHRKIAEQIDAPLLRPIAHEAGHAEATAGPALYIPASQGSAVLAPCAGEILYAGKFRSYGQLIILGCPHGATVVLGGMDHLRVSAGRRVRRGQSLGAMPKDPGPPPRLYTEVRRDNVPQDPTKFFH